MYMSNINNNKIYVQLLIDVKRCASRESLDTCEDFGNLNPSNTCTFLIMNNMAWTPFIQSIKPAFKCPIKAVRLTFIYVTGKVRSLIMSTLSG